jgi:hypothetical protein
MIAPRGRPGEGIVRACHEIKALPTQKSNLPALPIALFRKGN